MRRRIRIVAAAGLVALIVSFDTWSLAFSARNIDPYSHNDMHNLAGANNWMTEREPHEILWRIPANSSANVLFLMLRAYDIDVSYSVLLGQLMKRGHPTTLDDVRMTGRLWGLDCDVYAVTPTALAQMPMPAIVHLDPLAADFEEGGRFVLLSRFDKDEDEVVIYDGTTAIRSVVPKVDFQELWSGVVLAANLGYNKRRWIIGLCYLALMGILAMKLFAARRPRRS